MLWAMKKLFSLTLKVLGAILFLLVVLIETFDDYSQTYAEDYIDELRTRYNNDPEDAILNGESGWW